jgi:hypothetical protein
MDTTTSTTTTTTTTSNTTAEQQKQEEATLWNHILTDIKLLSQPLKPPQPPLQDTVFRITTITKTLENIGILIALREATETGLELSKRKRRKTDPIATTKRKRLS